MSQPTRGNELEIAEHSIPVSGISTNTSAHLIQVTEDKLRIVYKEDRKAVTSSRDWIASASVALSLAVAMVTTEFKDVFVLTASQWQAVFIVALAAALFHSICMVRKTMKNPPMNERQFVDAVAGRTEEFT